MRKLEILKSTKLPADVFRIQLCSCREYCAEEIHFSRFASPDSTLARIYIYIAIYTAPPARVPPFSLFSFARRCSHRRRRLRIQIAYTALLSPIYTYYMRANASKRYSYIYTASLLCSAHLIRFPRYCCIQRDASLQLNSSSRAAAAAAVTTAI